VTNKVACGAAAVWDVSVTFLVDLDDARVGDGMNQTEIGGG